MAELKPCPFCGGTRLFVGTIAESEMQDKYYPDYKYNSEHYTVVCDYSEGGCGASTGGSARTKEAAIKAWNRRVGNEAVMLSIHPKWCEKIANGKKTVEVRKSKPKLETPFKCYIYCTVGGIKKMPKDYLDESFERGKVIGEFVCDDIRYADAFNFVVKEDGEKALEGSCINRADLFEYLGWETGMPRALCTPFYRWHISDLIIYHQPREIGEFRRICRNDLYCESCAMYSTHNGNCGNVSLQVRRPPQSWCYVKEGVFGARLREL